MSVTTGGAQATFAATLVDEWVRAGVRHAVICPGSRSAPLALAIAAREELSVHVRLDERGAGFFAVGLGLATGVPPVVVTTSGTAAAELHPAVAEADLARVPVIMCTADRPFELQGVGAPQSMDQSHLYGSMVRAFFDPGVADDATASAWRSVGARVVVESTSGPFGPGPVHLNLAFREPLVGVPDALPAGRGSGRPWHAVARRGVSPVIDGDTLALLKKHRGLLVAGAGCGDPAAVVPFAQALRWPLLADPRSGCRVDRPGVVAAADSFLRSPDVAKELVPEIVIQLGRPWASRVVNGFVTEAARLGAPVVAVDPWWQWSDPDRVVTMHHVADPEAFVTRAHAAMDRSAQREGTWFDRWLNAEVAAERGIDEALDPAVLSEPLLARRVFEAIDSATILFVSSSMPVRDLEWFGRPKVVVPRVLANRGLNGIDGICATAQGVAAVGVGPVVALAGDLAFLHDASSLVRAQNVGADGGSCTLVVVDNGGGAIFSFLPQAASVPEDQFESLFATPQLPDPAAVARSFGLETEEASTLEEFDKALASCVGRPGLRVLCARVPDRQTNVSIHEEVHRAASEAAAGALRAN